jgi:pyridoxine 5-phosphate synthase
MRAFPDDKDNLGGSRLIETWKQPMDQRAEKAGRMLKRQSVARSGKDNPHPGRCWKPINQDGTLFSHTEWKQRFFRRSNANPPDKQIANQPLPESYLSCMLKLGVNIDHVATVREARYRGKERGEPDPVAAALQCEEAGAHGITAHLREDRRHIQDRDVWKLREAIKTRLNLELANVPEIIAIALKLKPDIVCLVPERRHEVTTEGGLDVSGNLAALTETRKKMNDHGIEVSLFIAPDPAQIEAAARTGSQFIELHTGAFAESWENEPERERELGRLIAGAKQAHGLGLKVNAGHGLNYINLPLLHRVPHMIELNIGHSLVSRAVTVGLSTAVREMLRLMENYDG